MDANVNAINTSTVKIKKQTKHVVGSDQTITLRHRVFHIVTCWPGRWRLISITDAMKSSCRRIVNCNQGSCIDSAQIPCRFYWQLTCYTGANHEYIILHAKNWGQLFRGRTIAVMIDSIQDVTTSTPMRQRSLPIAYADTLAPTSQIFVIWMAAIEANQHQCYNVTDHYKNTREGTPGNETIVRSLCASFVMVV